MDPRRKKRLDSFPKLKKLTSPSDRDFSDASFKKVLTEMAKKLEKSGSSGLVQLNVKEGRKIHKRTVNFTQNASSVEERSDDASLEVDMDVETFQQIMSGELAPFSAMLMDKMQITGSCEVARRVYSNLAGAGQSEIRV